METGYFSFFVSQAVERHWSYQPNLIVVPITFFKIKKNPDCRASLCFLIILFGLQIHILLLRNSTFSGGVGYCFGSSDFDCWYLYTLGKKEIIENNNFNYDEPRGKKLKVEPDQTLEVLMTDLDPNVMSVFTKKNSSSASEATQVLYSFLFSGIVT